MYIIEFRAKISSSTTEGRMISIKRRRFLHLVGVFMEHFHYKTLVS